MSSSFATLKTGMAVHGADGHRVGDIKAIQDRHVLVHRTLQPAVRVPVEAIHDVSETTVVLVLTASEIDDLYWIHAGEDIEIDLHGIDKYDYISP